MSTYECGRAIKRLVGPDGSFYVDVVARNDGTFQYFAAQHDACDGPGKFHPIGESGVFSTAEDAENAARLDFKL